MTCRNRVAREVFAPGVGSVGVGVAVTRRKPAKRSKPSKSKPARKAKKAKRR